LLVRAAPLANKGSALLSDDSSASSSLRGTRDRRVKLDKRTKLAHFGKPTVLQSVLRGPEFKGVKWHSMAQVTQSSYTVGTSISSELQHKQFVMKEK
jgi:hypothetical protein